MKFAFYIAQVGKKKVEKSTISGSSFAVKYLNDDEHERTAQDPPNANERQNRFKRTDTRRR